MLKFLLDTNICIYLTKKQPPSVSRKLAGLVPGEAAISVITLGELEFGAARSERRGATESSLEQLAEVLPVLPLTPGVAKIYGAIRARLQKAGTPIGNNDLWIAAHAIDLEVILVTNNASEFRRVRELKVVNWV